MTSERKQFQHHEFISSLKLCLPNKARLRRLQTVSNEVYPVNECTHAVAELASSLSEVGTFKVQLNG